MTHSEAFFNILLLQLEVQKDLGDFSTILLYGIHEYLFVKIIKYFNISVYSSTSFDMLQQLYNKLTNETR